MSSEGPLVNRVANSGLINLNLEDHFPTVDIISFDLKDHLFQGLILKEKDFRSSLKELDWTSYDDKVLLVFCSTDAIIPVWAYMLVAAYAAPHAQQVYQGNQESFLRDHYRNVIQTIDASEFEGKRIVIKGCSNKPVPPAAYLELTRKLQPYAQSIMYGEPCSTVPIFKRPRKINRD
ncbi:MAG: DUF2480 family protein [Saprospiraceae bacterium]|nr:DUF2480 family protein [Saprospiraceae bacterium]